MKGRVTLVFIKVHQWWWHTSLFLHTTAQGGSIETMLIGRGQGLWTGQWLQPPWLVHVCDELMWWPQSPWLAHLWWIDVKPSISLTSARLWWVDVQTSTSLTSAHLWWIDVKTSTSLTSAHLWWIDYLWGLNFCLLWKFSLHSIGTTMQHLVTVIWQAESMSFLYISQTCSAKMLCSNWWLRICIRFAASNHFLWSFQPPKIMQCGFHV
jgi:hypothetical protein